MPPRPHPLPCHCLPRPPHTHPAGAGARCEGEDWVAIGSLPSLDMTAMHVYDRQMESVPPEWKKCDFTCYLNYFKQVGGG